MLPIRRALRLAVEWTSPWPFAAVVSEAGATTSLVMGVGASITAQSRKARRLIALRLKHSLALFWANGMQKMHAGLDCHLSADLYDPAGWDLEVIGSVVCRSAHRDEQMILPPRHPRLRGWLQRPARDKERRRHDVELPAEFAREPERLGNVWTLHEAEAQLDGRKPFADGLHPETLGRGDPRGLRGQDRQDHVLLVKHFVVLEIVQERGRHEARVAGQKNRGTLDDMRWALFEALE